MLPNIGKHVLHLILLSSFFSVAFSRRSASSNITWWCNKTPHPGPCEFFMRQNRPSPFRPKHRSEFRRMMVHLALQRTLVSQSYAKQYGQNCKTPYQRAALSDCLKLYDNTVFHLNRTLQGLKKRSGSSAFDIQTWLSTALTNIETCRSGSLELNVSQFITPIMSSNVSQLVSNGLAINGYFFNNQGHKFNHAQGFPSWVNRNERRLLIGSKIKAQLVVAKDGSGNFKTIQAAIDAAAKRRSKTRFVIYVKRGVYRENIEVDKTNNEIMLVGAGAKYTIITSNRSVQGGTTTYNSATAGIDGPHFIARDITFSNTAGPLKGQAVALRSASDLSVFYRCAFQGYQDTLMVHAQRQFYRECYIYGTIDFIFGNAAVVFQNCMIYVRRPLKGQANIITAQGRNDPFQNTGISIHNSQIRPAKDLQPVVSDFQTYLGRPWQQYSRTVVMKTYMGSFISPLGWSKWGNSDFALGTLYYGEYNNFGPGSSTKNRVRWPGFHKITSSNEASRFTVSSLLAGRTWLPATGVPFKSGI